MTNVPEVICHSVYYYMLCRYNVCELHWALTNCLEMIEGSTLYDHEKAIEYNNMKNTPIPSADGSGEQPEGETGHMN